jgi:hypothetical protein
VREAAEIAQRMALSRASGVYSGLASAAGPHLEEYASPDAPKRQSLWWADQYSEVKMSTLSGEAKRSRVMLRC